MNKNAVQKLKSKVIRELKQIEKSISSIAISGELCLTYSGIPVNVWDEVIGSITEFPIYKHIVSIGKVTVYLILD